MKTAILYKIRDLRVKDVPKPKVLPGQALIKVKAVGICGSDVHYFTHGRIGNQIVTKPQSLGHEAAGLVVSVGKGVTNVKKGDRVAIEPAISCGKCEFCLSHRPNICPNVKFFGTPPIAGAYVEYLVHPANLLFKLPENMDYIEGALLEPLTVGMYAVELAELNPHEEIVILGMGPIGLSILKSALYAGVKKIYAVDFIKERLKYAVKHPKVTTIDASKEPVKTLMKLTKNRGVDIVFEAAGKPEAVAESVAMARIGGRCIWVGIPEEDVVSFEPHIARRKELVIKMVRRTKHQNEKAIEIVGNGGIILKGMATHFFKLKDIKKGFELVEKYGDGVIKAVVVM